MNEFVNKRTGVKHVEIQNKATKRKVKKEHQS